MHKISIEYPTPERISGKNRCGRSSNAGPPKDGGEMIDFGKHLIRRQHPSDYLTNDRTNPGLRRPLIQDPEVNSNSRVLILAPHHFDEILGCGGTMCKLAKKGAHVRVVYMTHTSYNGSLGNGCNLVPIERKEAEESLARLRCYEFDCLNLPCLEMRCDKDHALELFRIMDSYSPDLLFIPSLSDRHPDNKMTGLLAACALREYPGRLTLYSYEVWGGLFPNTMVEITEVIEDKIAAIEECHTRAKLTDGGSKIRDANIFKLSTMAAERYCEPFTRQQKVEFLQEVW
jgi:LmbE family N-acetylglucosaminyl deacetylase